MRFAIVAIALLLLVIPAFAHGETTARQSFGTAVCRNKIPCPGTGYGMSGTELAAAASTCLAQNFSLNSPSGFFDESSGLDTNGCLTTKTGSDAHAQQLLPQCCVTTLGDQTCAFRCDILTTQ